MCDDKTALWGTFAAYSVMNQNPVSTKNPLPAAHRYFAVYKPFGMLSQFSKEGARSTLADLGTAFPKEVYPIGRLDADSEGLLLLTDERSLTRQLLDPTQGHEREYWVQVEGVPGESNLDAIRQGPTITVDGRPYRTGTCKAALLENPSGIPDRQPPVRFRKTVPDAWISITLKEGKNRQVRKMTAAAGLPTLRLIRVRIGDLELSGLKPGHVRELSRSEFLRSMAGKS